MARRVRVDGDDQIYELIRRGEKNSRVRSASGIESKVPTVGIKELDGIGGVIVSRVLNLPLVQVEVPPVVEGTSTLQSNLLHDQVLMPKSESLFYVIHYTKKGYKVLNFSIAEEGREWMLSILVGKEYTVFGEGTYKVGEEDLYELHNFLMGLGVFT